MRIKLKVIIVSVVAFIMLIGTLLFAINYKKESIKYFNNSGYVINNVYDSDSSVNKYYFDENTSYEVKQNNYSFKNSDGKKVTVSEESFVHYSNGDIMSLKDGVAIDLEEIDSNLISYYNVFSSSVLKKTLSGYQINNLSDIITFKKLMYKISNNKYLIAASNIVVCFSDDQTTNMKDYVEIEYVDENVIKIYNEDVNYQTIASNLFIILDNVKVDLGYKTISKNNKTYLTMADMVINASDNIEVLPKLDINEPTDENIQSNENENNTNDTNNSETDENIINQIGNMPIIGDNEQQTGKEKIVQPNFVVESFEVTQLGFKKFKASLVDKSDVLYGDRKVELIENATGKVIETFDDWVDGDSNYSIESYYSLKPNASYTLNVTGQYKIDDEIYDRTFISKIFRTLDIGIEISEDYVTSNSVSYLVYKNDYSNATGFDYVVVDENGKSLCEGENESLNKSFTEVTCDKNILPNSTYKLIIKNFKYDSDVFPTEYFGNLTSSYSLKTLKSSPIRDNISLDYDVDRSKNTIRLGVRGIDDVNSGIVSFTYKVYSGSLIEENGVLSKQLLYTTTKDKYSDIELELSSDYLKNEEKIIYNLEIAFDDNEKTIIYTTQDSELIKIDSILYPEVIGYESSSDESIDCETLSGALKIKDTDNFIERNSINSYRVVIKEKSNSNIVDQQFQATFDVETQKNGEDLELPVYLEKLKPNTKYVLYVYFKQGNKYLYLGYATAKTKAIDPVYFNVEPTEQNDELFAFLVTYGNKTPNSNSLLSLVRLELYKCSESDKCEKTDFNRTIPREQGNTELSGLKETNQAVLVKSSEFGFDLSSYDSNASYYKIKFISMASNYELNTELESSMYTVSADEFKLKFSDVKPKLSVTKHEVYKQDCTNGTNCYENYNLSDIENLDDTTIVGYTFDISTTQNIYKEKIDKVYYAIYGTNSDGSCDSKNILSNGVIDLTNNNSNNFIKVTNNNTDNGNTDLMRGNKYCFEYYGEYLKNDNNPSTTDKQVFLLKPLKQRSKITGYLKSYDGNSVTFKLKITDVDKAIDHISLRSSNIDIAQNIKVDTEEYIFDNVSSENNYWLNLSENLGDGSSEYQLYELKLDSIITYPIKISEDENTKFNLIVDGRESGKLIIKIPYSDTDVCNGVEGCITNIIHDTSTIAGLMINGIYQDLIRETNFLKAEINLSEISKYKLKIGAGNKIDLSESDIKVIYDSGKINDEDIFFVKSVTAESNYKYYNSIIKKFSTISTNSIFRNNKNNVEPSFNIEPSYFISSDPSLKIGYYSEEGERVHLNKAEVISNDKISLFGVDGDGTIEVDPKLSTTEVKIVKKSTGAYATFRIIGDVSNNLFLKFEVKDEFIDDKQAYKTIEFKNGTMSGESNIIESISYDENTKEVKVNFNLLNEDDYSFSIDYKYSGGSDVGYNPTYNDFTKSNNEDIVISVLKSIDVLGKSAKLNKTYWNWESNSVTDFIKNIKIDFITNNDVYELGTGEEIRFDIFAKKGEEKIELLVKDNDEAKILKTKTEYSYSFSALNKNLDGTYSIVLIPELTYSGGKRSLGEITIEENLEITKKSPQFTVTNSNTPVFNITSIDADGVFETCNYDNAKLEYERTKDPINYIDSLVENYYSINKNVHSFNKEFFLEIYDEEDDFVGYTPITFNYKTSRLNLYNLIGSGNYKLKIKYCVKNNNEIQLKEQIENINILADRTLNVNVIKLPSSYVLVMNKPNETNREKIDKIEYQYYYNGTKVSKSIEKSNLEYIVSYDSDGKSIYFLPILLNDGEVTANVRNLQIEFKDIEGNNIPGEGYYE